MKPQIVRHGEVLLVPSTLPTGAKLKIETDKYIVAHSETGHHHVLESKEKYQIYSWKGDTYIQLGALATLFHEKTGQDVHTPHKLQPATYKIVIKKQFDYFAGKLERVRD